MEPFDQTTTLSGRRDTLRATHNIRNHWPEYLMEAGELAVYMFSTCLFATLLHYPASPVRHAIQADLSRRALVGLAIGTTVGAMILSPWGQQSGGHFNPALTIAFFRLGKLEPWDAFFYAIAQFLGAIAGVAVASFTLRDALAGSAVRYAVTVPGIHGKAAAFVAETAISFVLMITILFVSNRKLLAPYTPYFVGALYATFFTLEAPLSGMSMNPARTFASALYASYWHALWIYFIAPTFGMLLAAEVFLYVRGGVGSFCAKVHHANKRRCIFHHSQHEVSFMRDFSKKVDSAFGRLDILLNNAGAFRFGLESQRSNLTRSRMKAGGLIVLISALVSTLTAQTTEPSENLPPRVLRTAEMIGMRSQVEELLHLRSAPKPDEIRELQLAQHLQGVVIASALDVESVNARIDYETAHLQEVQAYLSARRDGRVDLLNLGNLFIGGGVGAVGSGLQLISSAQHAGNVVSTSAGFGGTVLSVIGLKQQKGQLRSLEYTPAMLAKLLGSSPPDSSDYPREVWVYLTTPDPTLPHGSTGQEHLVSEWTRFGHLKEKPDPKTMAALTTTGKDGTKLSIEMIGERTAMLADLRAHVSTMLVDLAELMMFVAQAK